MSSVGLGHAARSYSVARQLRRISGKVSIEWVCSEPASLYLSAKGERVLKVGIASLSPLVEAYGDPASLGAAQLLREVSVVKGNCRLIEASVDFEKYDLLVFDEFWEGFYYLLARRTGAPCVVITDFVHYPYRSLRNLPLALLVNRFLKAVFERADKVLFVGYPDEVPEGVRWFFAAGERLGKWARAKLEFVGYIPSFAAEDVSADSRGWLGLGESDRVLVAAAGGTSVGKELLKSVAALYPKLSAEHGNLKMFVLLGPRIRPSSVNLPPGVIPVGFVESAFRYYAAADVVVAQPGLGTVADLVALNVPSVLVPLTGYYEHLMRAAYAARRWENVSAIPPTGDFLSKLYRVLRLKLARGRGRKGFNADVIGNPEKAARAILGAVDA